MTTDVAETLLPGPWQHRFVAANGARFHVAEAGSGPLVVLLHGFPQFWWCWRAQIPALAAAGYRVAAMDLRGYGASDKPPRGYDTATLASDVAGVIRVLGAERAVVVGHDWGAWLAWSLPSYAPRLVRAVAALSAPHPLLLRRALAPAIASGTLRDARLRPLVTDVLSFQVPMAPERRLRAGGEVERVLSAWGGPGYPSPEEARRYRRAMQAPFVSHTALEYYRWAVRSVPRRDGRRFAAMLRRRPVSVPVLHLLGEEDGLLPPDLASGVPAGCTGPLSRRVLPGAGHFLPEEAPDAVTRLLLEWLAELPEG